MSFNSYAAPFLASVCAIACITDSVTVFAQATDDEGAFEIEEILVTARKRGESLQDVPVTVSAFTEDQLNDIGLESMRDYAKLVPNFFLVETQNSTFTFANIRGITQARNLDASVAVVVDGVLSTTPISMSQELFDIEQIEVYKGPQGALYGRNAMGGAINIKTKPPSDEIEGFARGSFGNGTTGKIQAGLSGPLDKDGIVLARIAASYTNSDGFRDNVTLGKKGDPRENTSLRARFLINKWENLDVDLRLSLSDDNSSALGFIDVSPIFHEIAPGSPLSLGALIGAFPPPSPPFNAGPVRGGPATSCLPPPAGGCPGLQVPGQALNVGNPNVRGVPLQNNLNGIEHRRIYNVSLKMDWDVSLGTVTSITSYDRANDFAIGEQPPRTAGAAQKNTQYKTSESVSQELRLTSPDDQRLRWIAGAYLALTNNFLSTTVQRDFDGVDSLTDLVRRDPFAAPSGICMGNPFPIGSPNDNQGNCVMGFDGDQGNNTAYAFFGQFSYDVIDTVEASFSARFDRDERRQIVRTPNSLFQVPTPLAFGDIRPANFDSFQPKATLRWTPRDNVTTYVSWAKGFRSGGFNRPGIQALADANRGKVPLPIPLGIADIYKQQTTKGLEAGFKYNSEDRRFVVNVSGFVTQVDNYQTFTAVTIGALLSQVIIPVDKIDLAGVEFDATANITEELSLNVGFGYTDSEIKRDSARGFVGNKAPMTPDTTINLGVNYRHPISLGGSEGTVFIRYDWQRIGELFFMPGNFAKRNPLNLMNIRGGIESESGWRLEAWAKNLANKDFFAEMFNPAGFGFPGQLRQWGFDLTRRF